ncbi:MAG: Calx-beta domain-containing protein [Kiritimatiellia bacterium]
MAINDVSVQEGRSSTTTNAIFTVSLSATSAVDVVVQWQTADGTATSADNDYQAGSGSLTITAGSLQGIITVTVNGDDRYEANETFYLNLTSALNATIADNQGVGTIVNDDWTFYVRGDGQGSDSNDGSLWSRAFATLQKALTTIPKPVLPNPSQSTPKVINVQASSGSQAYDVASYSCGYYNPGPTVDVEFQGGWQNVDTAPVQTGWSVVQDLDGTVNEPGIHIDQDTSHSSWKRVVVNRFVFTNVTRGIELTQGGAADKASIWLTVSNTVVYALNDGLYVDYPKDYPSTSWGGPAKITALNVDIVAGQGGAGHGMYIRGAWMGSSVSASGTDPRTGEPRVLTIRSSGSSGVYFSALNNETHDTSFVNTVVYDCIGDGIYLDARRDASTWYRVQAMLNHCTIANNGGDGLRMLSRTSSSWANAQNCIFAGNGGAGIRLGESGYNVFTCTESYNVFYGDEIIDEGNVQTPHATSSTRDPEFWASRGEA